MCFTRTGANVFHNKMTHETLGTVEWTETTSPPMGHGNFEKAPVVHRGPYEYSVPGESSDFTPQTQS